MKSYTTFSLFNRFLFIKKFTNIYSKIRQDTPVKI